MHPDAPHGDAPQQPAAADAAPSAGSNAPDATGSHQPNTNRGDTPRVERDDVPDAGRGHLPDAGRGHLPDADPGDVPPPRWRLVLSRTATVLAFLLVLLALAAPDRVGEITPRAFLRIPIEAVVGVALVLVLPPRARRRVVAVAGALLGVVVVMKSLDAGFSATLARQFHPMFDWDLLRPGFEFLTTSIGTAGAVAAAVVIALLVVAIPVLTARAALRLSRVAVRHRRPSAVAAGVLGVAWVTFALLGTQLVPGVPVADRSSAVLTVQRADQIWTDVRDQAVFARESAVDAYRDVPGDQLLTGLRGKDVVLAFVESYGRSSIDDPAIAPTIDALLDDGTARLRAAGYGSRSAYLTSSTAGGASWLAHGTMLSGLRIDTANRYRSLVSSDRLTLNNAFRRAGWESVAVVPGVTRDWPEAGFFGYDRILAERDLGYRGPQFGWSTMPDQYTLQQLQSRVRTPGHEPVMVEMPLLSSHAPWVRIPKLLEWQAIGDGSVYHRPESALPTEPLRRDGARMKADFGKSVEYTLGSLVSYVEKYGDDNLVLVFLGDHQPAPVITGEGASHDVPITIVAKDPKVLDQIAGWGWTDGLNPSPSAPVWPMESFRDRFLGAFSPRG